MDQLKIYCTSWYQAMVVALLYTEPTIKFYEFSHHAHRYIQHYGGTAALSFCDATVLALFELDLRSVSEEVVHSLLFETRMLINVFSMCRRLRNSN